MISVFSTLRDALLLWIQNFWYLVAFTLITDTPQLFLLEFQTAGHDHTHSPTVMLVSLISLFSMVFFNAVSAAAILGLLKRSSSENPAWLGVWNSVKIYTGTLCRLSIQIFFIAILVLAPIGASLKALKAPHAAGVMVIAIYLIFIKYALADPLVVVEHMSAWQALKRSWVMTKGHFWYVLGCYFVLWFMGWTVNAACGLNASNNTGQTTGISILLDLALYMFGSLWIIVPWCMYLRIKAADQPPDVAIQTA